MQVLSTQGHFGFIGSNSKYYGKALLFFSASFHCHFLAPTEYQCVIWSKLKTQGCLRHGVGGQQVVTVPELLSYAFWPGGVASISCTIHGKLWSE